MDQSIEAGKSDRQIILCLYINGIICLSVLLFKAIQKQYRLDAFCSSNCHDSCLEAPRNGSNPIGGYQSFDHRFVFTRLKSSVERHLQFKGRNPGNCNKTAGPQGVYQAAWEKEPGNGQNDFANHQWKYDRRNPHSNFFKL